MKSYRTAGVVLSVLFMMLFLGALAVRIWASDRSADLLGPAHVAVGQDRVYTDVNGELFVLSGRGALLARMQLEPLIYDKSPVDLRVVADGRVLLITQQPARIALCDPTTWHCSRLGQGTTSRIRTQLKVLPDEASGRLFITDAAGDQVWGQPLAGGQPRALAAKGYFSTPNDIAMDERGRLWVADSGHHRIVVLKRKGDGTWRAVRSFPADKTPARHGRDWPMMLARDGGGNWWVTQQTNAGKDGDLLVYSPDYGAVSRIDLPQDAQPTDVARLGSSMLVSDMDRFKIYRVDAVTHTVGEFGGAAFREAMRQPAEHKARYQALVGQSLIGMIAAGVLMLLTAFWASPKDKRWTPSSNAVTLDRDGSGAGETPPRALREVHWLLRPPRAERLLKWMKPALYLCPIASLAVFAIQYHLVLNAPGTSKMSPDELSHLKSMLIFMTVIIASVPFVGYSTLRCLQRRLGTDGCNLFVKLADDRQLTLMPEQLVYSASQIAYQGYVFPIKTGNGRPLYEHGELDKYVVPLLARAKRLGAWDMYRYKLGHREPAVVAGLIFIVILAVMLLATGVWQDILFDWR